MMQLMEWWCILLTAKRENTLTVCILTFQLNQGTCVLGCVPTDSTHSGHLLLLILVGRSYSWFITCHWNVYEIGVHVFIYYHTRSKQPRPEYRCLSLTVDWWVDTVVVLRSLDLWYIEETKFPYKGGFDVDYQWFFSLWNAFWLEHAWETSMFILHGKQQGIHANKQR